MADLLTESSPLLEILILINEQIAYTIDERSYMKVLYLCEEDADSGKGRWNNDNTTPKQKLHLCHDNSSLQKSVSP
jgi:hypothetical protein